MEKNEVSQNKSDVNATRSQRTGMAGILETLLRSFRNLTHILMLLPLYVFGALVVGLAITPGLWLGREVYLFTKTWPLVARLFGLGTALGLGYLTYGFSLVLLLPFFNFVFRLRLSAWRGSYYSLETLTWYIHNALTYLMRFTFLEFITPTPLALFYLRGMGMKIGRGTVINTSHISDPSLIRIGERVTIGGSASLMGHYGQGGYLVLAPVEIGNNATIGLKCSIMGGVKIGDGAKILPHSVVMPKTEIGPGEVWGGVPAVKMSLQELTKKTRMQEPA